MSTAFFRLPKGRRGSIGVGEYSADKLLILLVAEGGILVSAGVRKEPRHWFD